MKRREFIGWAALGSSILGQLSWSKIAQAADAKKLTEKDIFKEGMTSTIANYCENPEKQPNKACPKWPESKGHCETCNFYNKDKSETDYKGKKYARCLLLGDPSKPQFVGQKAWCGSYIKQA